MLVTLSEQYLCSAHSRSKNFCLVHSGSRIFARSSILTEKVFLATCSAIFTLRLSSIHCTARRVAEMVLRHRQSLLAHDNASYGILKLLEAFEENLMNLNRWKHRCALCYDCMTFGVSRTWPALFQNSSKIPLRTRARANMCS